MAKSLGQKDMGKYFALKMWKYQAFKREKSARSIVPLKEKNLPELSCLEKEKFSRSILRLKAIDL